MNPSILRVASVACASLLLLTGCGDQPRKTTTAVVPREEPPRTALKLPSLESRLANDWSSGATRIDSRDGSIFFYGTSQRSSPEGGPWLGTVEGDILFVSPRQAVVIPSGKLTLGAGSSIKVSGPHRTVVAEPGKPVPWQSLLSS
jgi:hypothetical protein